MSSTAKISILQRGGDKNHEVLEHAARFYLSRLMGARLASSLQLRIEVRATKLDNGTAAVTRIPCNGSASTREFTVVLRRDRSLRDQLSDLAHELVHVQQAASGRLQYRRWRTDGKVHARWEGNEMGVVAEMDYNTRPWEVEAYRVEAELVAALQAAVS